MKPLEVVCPECKAPKLQWCVYIQPNVPRTHSTEWMYERAGKPTQKLHNGRATKAYFLERQAKIKARQDEYAAKNAASAQRVEILRANATAVADEQRQIIDWLMKNHRIFLTGEE